MHIGIFFTSVMVMVSVCDIDNGHVGTQGSMYYEHDINAGPPVADTFKEILKGVTTGVASRYMVHHNISNHYQCISDINSILHGKGIGSIAVKGGLALRIVMDTTLKQWARDVHSNDQQLMNDAREYMMRTYAAPSDLDTGLYVTDKSRLNEALSLAKAEIVRMRDAWTVKDYVLKDIVSGCNDIRDETVVNLQAAGLDVVSIVFIANEQGDQHIEIVESYKDAECPYPKCNKVSIANKHSIFISDNSGLIYKKGHNIVDFHLLRAKWAVGAEVTRVDGSTCTVNCPAELIDIAASRSLDSRAPKSSSMGLDKLKTYVDAAGVKLSAVNLKFQMLDVMEMIQQAMNGAQDPKIGKRINRLIIMATMKGIDGYNNAVINDDNYELSKYEDFIVSNRWQDLMTTHTSNKEMMDCVHYIESLENDGSIQLDQQLLSYLFSMRDVYVAAERSLAMPFNAIGGKNGDRNMVAGLFCVGITLMMGMFPR